MTAVRDEEVAGAANYCFELATVPCPFVACELALALAVGKSVAVPRAKIEVSLVADEASCHAAELAPHPVPMSRCEVIVILGAVAVAGAGAGDLFVAPVGGAVAVRIHLQPRSYLVSA